METLSHDQLCSRKANRDAAVKAVADLAARLGVEYVDAGIPSYDKRTRRLALAFGEYRCSVNFDGDLKLSAFLAHWHTATRSSVVYPPDFPAESVNRYHFGKATTHAATFGDLLAKIEAGFVRLGAKYNTQQSTKTLDTVTPSA